MSIKLLFQISDSGEFEALNPVKPHSYEILAWLAGDTIQYSLAELDEPDWHDMTDGTFDANPFTDTFLLWRVKP